MAAWIVFNDYCLLENVYSNGWSWRGDKYCIRIWLFGLYWIINITHKFPNSINKWIIEAICPYEWAMSFEHDKYWTKKMKFRVISKLINFRMLILQNYAEQTPNEKVIKTVAYIEARRMKQRNSKYEAIWYFNRGFVVTR